MEKERKRKRRAFSAEYKAEAVHLIQRSGKSIGQMALELGCPPRTARRYSLRCDLNSAMRTCFMTP